MKKVILVAVFAIIAMVSVNAQNFGAKAGVNFATIGGDDTSDLESRTAFHIGVVAEFKISDKFSFQPELLYSGQGAKYEFVEPEFNYLLKGTLKLDYLNIPLMAKYYVAEGFSLEAGPQIGILLSAEDEWEASFEGVTESGTDDLKDEGLVKDIDFGLNFGVGYKLENGLNFGARYNLGLSNINDNQDSEDLGDNQNAVFQISVGYFFN